MESIKKELWYILTIIGTSCGVIGGFFSCAVLAHELEAWFIFWSSIVTVVGMVISVIMWGIKFILLVKKHLKEQREMLSDIEIAYGYDLKKSMENKAKQKEVKHVSKD